MADPAFDLDAWVRRSCQAQGVPVKVTDPEVVRRVGVLLGATEAGPRLGRQPARGTARRRSEAPGRLHPLGVQGPRSGVPGGDGGVVEHGGDDRRLPGQGEAGPLSA